ncbi:MAG: biopolymer transporter ExbD [Verrucomicrobiota bacterium]
MAKFSLDGQYYPTADALSAPLASLHGKNPASYVVIRADRDTEYSNISDLMSACGNAGISTVTFAVLIGGGDQKSPPKAASNP